jgi:hypothetical protein
MADTRNRKLGWLAALMLIAAGGLAACGEEAVTETAPAAGVEASRGSDQHLYNHAAEIAERSAAVVGSDVHLYNQAAEIAQSQTQPDATVEAAATDAAPNVWEAGNRAAAAALAQG